MRTALRLIASLLALFTITLWFAGGMNLGFTKTSVMLKSIDPVTEQEIIEWKKQFIPGVDFLGAGAAASVVLFGASFLFRHSPSHVQPT
jgi:uncharacterized membrane protein